PSTRRRLRPEPGQPARWASSPPPGRSPSAGAAHRRSRRRPGEAPGDPPLRARLPAAPALALALHGGPARLLPPGDAGGDPPRHAATGFRPQLALHHHHGHGPELSGLAGGRPCGAPDERMGGDRDLRPHRAGLPSGPAALPAAAPNPLRYADDLGDRA